jgi:hypothetical protein
MPARLMAKAAALEGYIRVPCVKNPKLWRTIGFNLSQPWRLIRLPELGWIVTILQVPAGPETPMITPAFAPTDVVNPPDKTLAPSVILPEGGTLQQYCLPVLEKYRWARLDTANFTVIFLRAPTLMGPVIKLLPATE